MNRQAPITRPPFDFTLERSGGGRSGPTPTGSFVSSIEDMRALTGLLPGAVIYVGDMMDQFVVVDDATLGADGGTVFIPNSELSEYYEETIPLGYFSAANVTHPDLAYTLAHTGIDFESVQAVLADDGETIDIWKMHGHVMNPGYYSRAPGALPWVPNKAYTTSNPENCCGNDGHMYICVTAGTSAASGGPTGNPGVGVAINDGTVVWNIAEHDPNAEGSPQLPLIECGSGLWHDPIARYTNSQAVGQPQIRAGGVLVRYKYATSGLRLKRVTGPVFQLRWWPVIAIEDEAPATQTDNSGKICWAFNAAAAAKAQMLYVDKMYYFGRVVEIPEGVELRGRGPGFSGFKCMDGMAYQELQLAISSAPDIAEYPILTPINRQWYYDQSFLSSSPAFFPATGARRIRISGIEIDGNVEGNMALIEELVAQPATGAATFAWQYTNSGSHLFNVPTWGGLVNTNNGARIAPPGMIIELDNVKFHGSANCLLGNHNAEFIGTGVVEVGNAIVNHWFYFPSGVYETVRAFGYCMGDGLRVRKFIAKSVEIIVAPHPDIMFEVTGNYAIRDMNLISANFGPQVQSQTLGFPWPELSPERVVIEHLFIDVTQLDNWPQAYDYEAAQPLLMGADHIHIKAGKIRFGNLMPAVTQVWSTGVNSLGLNPYRNIQIENLIIEHGSRAGMSFAQMATSGVSQLELRNITIEQRASTHIPGDPVPGGFNYCLGSWSFTEPVPAAYTFDGTAVEFSAVTADATLNGKYIDITPPYPTAPVYRVWFNYNALGSAPSATGVTLVEVPVSAVTPTPAKVAQAFSAALEGTLAAPGAAVDYLTAATFNTKSVVGAFLHYKNATTVAGKVTVDVTNAAGVTEAQRSNKRNYAPSYIGIERFIASDPTYLHTLSLSAVGTDRDLWFSFKDCVFGAADSGYITLSNNGDISNPTTGAVKDQVHFDFQNTMFDMRDTTTWLNWDLTLYAGKFRNCRIRTTNTTTGITTMDSAGAYNVLVSEQSDVAEVPATAGNTWIDIQTKLFWVPKPGQIRLYPADPAAAVVWNTNMPSVEWRKSARPVGAAITVGTGAGGTSIALGGSGAYYSVNEDRRAPVLRLNFASALPAGTIKIGWTAAVSP